MTYSVYQVDAFTTSIFKGNPACVVPLDKWLEDEILLNIAKENAVPETAFFVQDKDTIHLRWFTPDLEMDLCGHATLATAHVIKKHLQNPKSNLIFMTLSGKVSVNIEKDYYFLNFPSRMPVKAELPSNLEKSLNKKPQEVFKSRDFVLVYKNLDDVKKGCNEIQNMRILTYAQYSKANQKRQLGLRRSAGAIAPRQRRQGPHLRQRANRHRRGAGLFH